MIWRNFLVFCAVTALGILHLNVGRAEDRGEQVAGAAGARCLTVARMLAPGDTPTPRKYAPDRLVQMQHVVIDVTPDFQKRSIQSTATLTMKVASRPVTELKLDAMDLRVKTVNCSQKLEGWNSSAEHLVLTFAEALPPGKEFSVEVEYSAVPKQGLFFRTPEMGYLPGDTHLFTQGEETEGRYWYPCLDSPNQMPTTEMICRVPVGMTVISNGRLLSETNLPDNKLRVFRWLQDKPHANYLVSLVAGHLEKIEATHGSLPLAFYTPASQIRYARTSFEGTANMIAYFEQETGVKYPWDKYYQVCVNDFVAGGMENTSVTTLMDSTLFSEEYENIRSSEGLVAHELAHQWFGDLVTCKDWSHTWINEGFATYYEALYSGHKHGREHFFYEMHQRFRQCASGNDDTPIVRRTFNQPGEMFSNLSYGKASCVLHMLRVDLGEELYRKCVTTFLERFRHRNAGTEDFRSIIEELSGRTYDQFFDQWLYHGRYPDLEVSYTWSQSEKKAKLTVRQTQTLSQTVLLYNVPLKVRFKGSFGTLDRLMQVSKKDEEFSFALSGAPEIVRIDPELGVLANIKFQPTTAMIHAQLQDKEDVIGRLQAVEQLGQRSDLESLIKLKTAATEDSFYGVRLAAIGALRGRHTDEAFNLLLASTNQPDARVRKEAISAIGAWYSETAYAVARQVVRQEKNPDIVSGALRDLAGYAKPDVRDELLRWLDSTSYRNELADAAIRAMRVQDDPAYITPIMNALVRRKTEFTTGGLGQALETIGFLARNEARKDKVRGFLTGYLTEKRKQVVTAAINALGELGDGKAAGALAKFTTGSAGNREKRAAEGALSRLRSPAKPTEDLQTVRREVLELQRLNREMRKEIDDLKKKVEPKAAEKKSAASGA